MNYQEYQQNSKRTCPTLGSIELDLAHMVLGLCSELSELSLAIDKKDTVNTSEELADVNWYLSNYCTFRNIDFNSIWKPKFSKLKTVKYCHDIISFNVSELQDLIKKFIAYKKEINITQELLLLKNICYNIGCIYIKVGLDINKSLSNNIDKLKIRYPDKFTTENAINRNLDLELKELQK